MKKLTRQERVGVTVLAAVCLIIIGGGAFMRSNRTRIDSVGSPVRIVKIATDSASSITTGGSYRRKSYRTTVKDSSKASGSRKSRKSPKTPKSHDTNIYDPAAPIPIKSDSSVTSHANSRDF